MTRQIICSGDVDNKSSVPIEAKANGNTEVIQPGASNTLADIDFIRTDKKICGHPPYQWYKIRGDVYVIDDPTDPANLLVKDYWYNWCPGSGNCSSQPQTAPTTPPPPPAMTIPCKPGAWECSATGKCYGSHRDCMNNCPGGRCNAI